MRKILKKIHLWVGLIFCLPLILMGLSGSILIFERETENLLKPTYKLEKGETQEIEKIIEHATQNLDQNLKPNLYKASKDNNPALVRLSAKNKFVEVLIDPVSLQILEKKEGSNSIIKTIEQFHTSLLLRDYGGRNIVGIFGIAFLILALSGIIIWFPKVGSFKSSLFLQKNLCGFVFHKNLHKVFGFWSLVFIFIISFSGIYLAFSKQINGIFFKETFGKNITIEANKEINPKSLNDLVIKASNEFENAKLISIIFANKEKQPMRINFASDNYIDGQPYITVFINQFSGEILSIRNPQEYSIGEKFVSWLKPLHTAQGLGIFWYMIIFFIGLLPILFSITGFLMWKKKRK
jgi:uncharacterized iron-regulated membrane protein